jgi:hypothetical protein
MEVLELLDALEVEIRALRAERAKLAAAFELAQQQLRSLLLEAAQPAPVEARPPTEERAAAKRARKPRTRKSRRSRKSESAETEKPARTRPPRIRQALGKTLAQLRATPRRTNGELPDPAQQT